MRKTLNYILAIPYMLLPACAPDVEFDAEKIIPVIPESETSDNCLYTSGVHENGATISVELTESGYCLVAEASDKDIPDYRFEEYVNVNDTLLLTKTQDYFLHSTEALISGGDTLRMENIRSRVSPITHNLCRSWVPETTALTIKTGVGVRVGKAFSGCNIGEILETVVGYGANLKNLKKTQYSSLAARAEEIHRDYKERAETMMVTSLSFTKAGTFIVAFEGIPPYVGNWSWEDEDNGIFRCNFSMPDEKEGSVTVETTGQITFNKDLQCDLCMDASFTSNGIKYLAIAELICNRKI